MEMVGSNGIISASPSVVKFAGYTTHKTHTLKLRLTNNSHVSQRFQVLPPQTSYFKIKYQKKAMISAGIAEDIYIQFTPAPDEYKYYYDAVRVHCENDKILVPIHAYPVINSAVDTYFPKRVDLGRHCELGKVYTKQLRIESNCPADFEYQITVLKAHPEIQVSPMQGDIKGLQTTLIDFSYRPRTYATADCEIEVRTSEFDSQPQLIRITGNASQSSGLPKVDLGRAKSKQDLNVIQEEEQHVGSSSRRNPLHPKTLLQGKPPRQQL